MNKILLTTIMAATAFPAYAARPAPIGYTLFCMTQPGDCKIAMANKIEKTYANMSKISRINMVVNASIKPVNDAAEKWSVNVSTGDCEDYALTKRQRLIDAGFPAGALRIAVTRHNGQLHAVLIVKTTGGDFVLDNLNNRLIGKSQSGYRWIWVASENPMVGE